MDLSLPLLGWLQIIFFFAVLTALVRPVGGYIARVIEGEDVFLSPIMRPVESIFYSLSFINIDDEMTWGEYIIALLTFAAMSGLFLFVILISQSYPVISPDLAINIAASFVTNTDWQPYNPEMTMTPLSQMIGLTVQNYMSAAMGLSVLAVIARGFARREMSYLGNFWVDLVRSTFYVLFPLAFIVSLILLSQGVVQTFASSIPFTPLDGAEHQSIMTGPVASMLAIKEIGTNGDGYFATTAAHPFENPTPITNFIHLLSVFLIPAALTYTFGTIIQEKKHGWALYTIMFLVLVPLIVITTSTEYHGNPLLEVLPVHQTTYGNMEGKEVRFGAISSGMWTAINGASSSGSANASYDSMMPITIIVPLALIELGQVIFGGVGSGIYGLLLYVILTVFIANLLIGRTPEYLSKRIGATEIKFASLAVLIPAILTLGGAAIGMLVKSVREAAPHSNGQGFTEVLYAFASAANNNGSALGGLAADTPFFNLTLAFLMVASRFFVIYCIVAIAGSLVEKNKTQDRSHLVDTSSSLFIFVVIGAMLTLAVPAFLPSITLGPIAEQTHIHQLLGQ